MRVSAGVTAAAAAMLLSGCAELSQQTTQLQYDAADGISADVGALNLQDVLLVSPAAGSTASLSGLATNPTSQQVQLSIAGDSGSTATVTIPAGQSIRLDGKTSGDSTATVNPVRLQVKGAPGDTTTLKFTPAGGSAVDVEAPILLNQPPYGTASPSHATAEAPEGAEEGSGH